jgi:hypothetical protein
MAQKPVENAKNEEEAAAKAFENASSGPVYS